MYTKLLCIFVALFACQASNAGHIREYPEVYGIVEDLIGVVQAAVNKALGVVDVALDKSLKLVDVILDRINVTVDDAVKGGLAQLDHLKQIGLDAGVDVVKCTQAPEVTLHELPFDIALRTSDCAKEATATARKIVESAKDKINVKFEEAKGIAVECANCSVIDLVCLGKCTAKATVALASLPLKIAGFAAQATQDLVEGGSFMAKCEVEVVADTTGIIASIVTETTSCVNDVLSGRKPFVN